MTQKKAMLIILDGWGHGRKDKSDAVYNANTPCMDQLYQNYPHAELLTHGEHVGLPKGQMGNSEVGHLNIGAGRIVYQDLVKINKAIEDESLFSNKTLQEAIAYAKANNKTLHLMGLVSDGGVHSSQEHLHALCEFASGEGVRDIAVHAFTDGRDTDPKSGKGYLSDLLKNIEGSNARLATITGRYYAMDRDKRWERIAKAYQALVHGKGALHRNPLEAIQTCYDNGVTDEFIEPLVLTDDDGAPVSTIQEGDAVIVFNFRTDRCREITMALTQQDFPDYDMKKQKLHYVTMTRYDETFNDVKVIFEKENLKQTLGEVVANAGKKQVRIAETEKYPHVTFFFSGGREDVFEGEKRLMLDSPKVATYDLQPEMSAYAVRDTILEEIENHEPDFICLNFANPDMVGHTGVYDAMVKAVETVDACLDSVLKTALKHDYAAVIIADHGNPDYAINEDGSPNTSHTTNPVPVIIVNEPRAKAVHDGILADVAPTVLNIMGVEIPKEMTGKSLF